MENPYQKLSDQYRPDTIRWLLVGEALPPSGVYFYKPMKLRLGAAPENDRSPPSTIFGHYFGMRPENDSQYIDYLNRLKGMGIFLVDIVEEPLKISDRSYPGWVNPVNLEKVVRNIGSLRDRLVERIIELDERITIFLLARNKYRRELKKYFPTSQMLTWKEFRTKAKRCRCCLAK